MKLKQKYFDCGILVLVIVGIIVISGCIQQEVTCNPPYIKVGISCCLDINNNSICDKDETLPTQTQQTTSSQTTTSIITSEKTFAVVSEVVDGDTIKLQTGETVRLLGINAPEKGQPYYEQATNRMKELIEDKTVILEKDIEDKDLYGRLLRYIFFNNENINLKLVKEGLATVYIISPNVKFESELKQAETEAKNLEIGIWTPATPKEDENICDSDCIVISYFHWNAEGNDCYNLNDEYVILKNSCSYSCDLTEWTVKDESSRDPYVFSSFVLENNSEVTLYTGCGVDIKTELYWCSSGYSCNAIWNNNGDTLYLRNSNGELVLSYTYVGY